MKAAVFVRRRSAATESDAIRLAAVRSPWAKPPSTALPWHGSLPCAARRSCLTVCRFSARRATKLAWPASSPGTFVAPWRTRKVFPWGTCRGRCFASSKKPNWRPRGAVRWPRRHPWSQMFRLSPPWLRPATFPQPPPRLASQRRHPRLPQPPPAVGSYAMLQKA